MMITEAIKSKNGRLLKLDLSYNELFFDVEFAQAILENKRLTVQLPDLVDSKGTREANLLLDPHFYDESEESEDDDDSECDSDW